MERLTKPHCLHLSIRLSEGLASYNAVNVQYVQMYLIENNVKSRDFFIQSAKIIRHTVELYVDLRPTHMETSPLPVNDFKILTDTRR